MREQNLKASMIGKIVEVYNPYKILVENLEIIDTWEANIGNNEYYVAIDLEGELYIIFKNPHYVSAPYMFVISAFFEHTLN